MRKIFAVMAIVILWGTFAFAAEDVLPKLDKNKDGKVSSQEYVNAVTGMFDVYDKNGDGVLTRDEVRLIDKIDVEKFMADVDADKDGRILKKEFEQAAKKRFSTVDKNRNGFCDKKEWEAGRSELYSPFSLFTF